MAHVKTVMADSGGIDQKVQRLYTDWFNNLVQLTNFLTDTIYQNLYKEK